MLEEDPPPSIKPIEPGIAFCHCGRKMQVKASRMQAHLGVPIDEIMDRLRREGGVTAEKMWQALDEYDIFKSWHLTYQCRECRAAMSDFQAQFTEKEAREIASRSNSEKQSQGAEAQR